MRNPFLAAGSVFPVAFAGEPIPAVWGGGAKQARGRDISVAFRPGRDNADVIWDCRLSVGQGDCPRARAAREVNLRNTLDEQN